jgi:hypothetical protein
LSGTHRLKIDGGSAVVPDELPIAPRLPLLGIQTIRANKFRLRTHPPDDPTSLKHARQKSHTSVLASAVAFGPFHQPIFWYIASKLSPQQTAARAGGTSAVVTSSRSSLRRPPVRSIVFSFMASAQLARSGPTGCLDSLP